MRTPPTLTHIAANGVSLALWEWDGPGDTLLFVHATGFHARCWDAVIERFPDRRCLALDLRGHGRSETPAPPTDWRVMGEDVAAIARSVGLDEATAVGHSMGGHAIALAAAVAPAALARLVLIDPVILAPDRYTGAREGEHFAARRRDRWPSADAMIERFAGRAPFDAWEPRVLRDYCEYGLLPEGRGFALACPPEIEASIYSCSKEPETKLWDAMAGVKMPVLVLRAGYGGDRPFSRSPTDPRLASWFPMGRDVLLEDRTHLIPMEAPEVVAEYIREQAADGCVRR